MLILPSLLAAPLSDIKSVITKLKISVVHFDVMDGVFVPEISFGSFLAKDLQKNIPDLKLDVHLMVANPSIQVENFLISNCFRITFHYENNVHHLRLAVKIRATGKKVGLAINPETPVSMIKDIIRYFDSILVMSVCPGYSGQQFLDFSKEKVKELTRLRERENLIFSICVDGGVDDQIARELSNLKVDEVVMGKAFFNK